MASPLLGDQRMLARSRPSEGGSGGTPVREQLQDLPLLRAAQAGDAEALDALLRRHLPHVHRFGMKMCRDREDAQEVLQETLFAAARGLRGFRGASSLSTWLFAIARSFCIKKRRRSAFAPEVISLDSEASPRAGDSPDGAPDPERRLAGIELVAELTSAIASLPPAHREALILSEVDGLSPAEAAAATAVSVAALKSRLHRARAEVRRRLAPLLAPSRRGH
jgi:RNA polymerase sigma-70 factor (ECF subfamily)